LGGQIGRHIALRKKNQGMHEDFPRLLTVQQAARKSGKSEKTIRRWIKEGKLAAEQPGGPAGVYLIKREDLEAVIPHVTKEWQEHTNQSALRFQVTMLETAVEELQELVYELRRDIDVLQEQVKKFQPKPKKKPATRRTSTTRARRRDEYW
jgi:excisionase family DNA binding protein